MSPSNSISGNGIVSPAENGILDFTSVLSSEKSIEELVQQPPLQGIEENLIEFSEALRTVAKALRRVTEGKASAQAEAAEWKRKYELAREHNLQLEQKENSKKAGGDFFNRGKRAKEHKIFFHTIVGFLS